MGNFKVLAFATVAMLTLSCSSDDAATLVNEEEVITSVTATFTPQSGGTPIVLSSRDLDGDGPNAPIVTVSGNFTAGAAYNGNVAFLNELASPAEDITAEIETEAEEHQIFFQGVALGAFTYADEDENGYPIGLDFTFTAVPAPATGTLTITLRHQPDKSAQGVAGGSITNAGGNTDAIAQFSVSVIQP